MRKYVEMDGARLRGSSVRIQEENDSNSYASRGMSYRTSEAPLARRDRSRSRGRGAERGDDARAGAVTYAEAAPEPAHEREGGAYDGGHARDH